MLHQYRTKSHIVHCVRETHRECGEEQVLETLTETHQSRGRKAKKIAGKNQYTPTHNRSVPTKQQRGSEEAETPDTIECAKLCVCDSYDTFRQGSLKRIQSGTHKRCRKDQNEESPLNRISPDIVKPLDRTLPEGTETQPSESLVDRG